MIFPVVDSLKHSLMGLFPPEDWGNQLTLYMHGNRYRSAPSSSEGVLARTKDDTLLPGDR
jgi:hypothetical protein